MTRLGQSTGLVIVAVTSSLALIFLSLLVYQSSRLTFMQLPPRSPNQLVSTKIVDNNNNTSSKSQATDKPSTTTISNSPSPACSSDQIVDAIVDNMQNTSLMQNFSRTQSSTVFQEECQSKYRFSNHIVQQVIHKLGVKCRKKSRIIKVYHHPKTAQLHSGEGLQTKLIVDSAVSEFVVDPATSLLSNQNYANSIFEKLETAISDRRSRKQYNLHVTVFTSSGSEDLSIQTENTNWVWRREMKMAFGRKRVLVVLISYGTPDVDRLDCLQHLAANIKIDSLCVGHSSQCVRSPDEKSLKVYSGCRSEDNEGFGVLVICWGCDVWHRWTPGFPVLHVQNSEVWNNLVWAHSSHQ